MTQIYGKLVSQTHTKVLNLSKKLRSLVFRFLLAEVTKNPSEELERLETSRSSNRIV